MKNKKDKDRWLIDRLAIRADKQQSIRLRLRRAYVLPTQKGFYYAMTLIIMFIWSVNYALSLGYAVTFFVATFGLIAMVLTVMNLSGIQVTALDRLGNHASFFAGETAYFRLQIDNQKNDAALQFQAHRNGLPAKAISIAAQQQATINVPLDEKSRGVKSLDYVRLSSDYPIGLFRSWMWFYFEASILIYPAPVGHLPLPFRPEQRGVDDGQADVLGSEDFADLRAYRPGDNLRHIVWKKAALGQVSVKTFKAVAGQECVLDFHDSLLAEMDVEARLSQLCAWVLLAEQKNTRYRLQLPNQRIDFGLGQAHLTRCLEALACY